MNPTVSRTDLISPLSYNTIPDALLAAPAEDIYATMWTSEDEVESVTFGEFRQRAFAQACFFRDRGIDDGQRIILVMPQGLGLMAAFVGAMIAGGVPAILAYPNFKIEPTKYSLGLRGVSTNLKASIIVLGKEFPDDLMRYLNVEPATRLFRFEDDYTFSSFPNMACKRRPNDLAFIQHSAGTTGLQKGVALCHSAVLKHVGCLVRALKLTPEDRIYSWLPLYHDMGLIACFMLPLVCHLPVVVQSPAGWVMQPATMLELISAYRCSLAWAPNFALQFLARRVRAEDRATYDLSSLRALINCSEPIRDSSMKEFLSAYSGARLRPHVLQTSYAMAEAVFAVTQSDVSFSDPCRVWIDGAVFRKDDRAVLVQEATPGALCVVSSGRCIENTQVRIVDNDGNTLNPGDVGEIIIHSDTRLEGYFNRPDLTFKALHGEWYHSGDLGFILDEELYVVGRKTDLIIVAGENYYPQDIEEIAASHPSIHDGRVVAFGQYNPALGTQEIILVAEVLDERDLSNSGVIEREIRSAVTAEMNVGIGSIFLRPPRWIVKSTAGKPGRSANREKLSLERLELHAQSGRY
jgi:acyl-CoA synthetase (AMP-forming)/AMP-acid ligase II